MAQDIGNTYGASNFKSVAQEADRVAPVSEIICEPPEASSTSGCSTGSRTRT